jgi:hypothetical protein
MIDQLMRLQQTADSSTVTATASTTT